MMSNEIVLAHKGTDLRKRWSRRVLCLSAGRNALWCATTKIDDILCNGQTPIPLPCKSCTQWQISKAYRILNATVHSTLVTPMNFVPARSNPRTRLPMGIPDHAVPRLSPINPGAIIALIGISTLPAAILSCFASVRLSESESLRQVVNEYSESCLQAIRLGLKFAAGPLRCPGLIRLYILNSAVQ